MILLYAESGAVFTLAQDRETERHPSVIRMCIGLSVEMGRIDFYCGIVMLEMSAPLERVSRI